LTFRCSAAVSFDAPPIASMAATTVFASRMIFVPSKPDVMRWRDCCTFFVDTSKVLRLA
jgi:hypothetical protein